MESIDRTARENVRLIAKAYAKATGKSLGAVSKETYGNSSFLGLYLEGKGGLTFEKMQKVLDAFRGRWPEGTPWPICSVLTFAGPRRPPRRKVELSPAKSKAA